MQRALLHPIVIAVAAAAALAALWMFAFPTVGTDLSAQLARAHFAGNYPEAAYDFSWYSGIYPASYSLLAPYVFAVVGTRLTAALAAVVCAGLIGWLFVRHHLPSARVAALWAAVGLGAGLLAGRATFTLGLTAATAAIVVVDGTRPRRAWRLVYGAALALLASMFSPLAGAFVAVAAIAFAMTGRRSEGIVLGLSAALPVGLVTVVFGSGGLQPIHFYNGGPSLVLAVLVVICAPPGWRMVRVGAGVYALAIIGAWLVPSAVGSNVERLGLMLGGPLLIAAMSYRRRRLAICGLVVAVGWQIVIPVRDFVSGTPASANPASTAGLIRELSAVHADTARLEAVPQYGHWESDQLAAVAPLARGWERQIDTVRNPIFYRDTFSADDYRQWLDANAVGYVALSDAKPDYAAAREAQIVHSGQPWLRPVWHDSSWALYRVSGATPLADPPARVVRTTPASMSVAFSHPGTAVIRIRWSKFLRVDGGGQLHESGQWIALSAPRAGTYSLYGRY